jgi:hypothetical protein
MISAGVVAADGAKMGVAFAPPVTAGVSPVYLDSFTGTDDAKLTAAMSYAAAQTHIPAIEFPARTVTLNTGGRIPYNGLKLIAPHGSNGPKNLELSPALAPCQVNLNVGSDASALFNGAGLTIYDMYVEGLAFQNTNGASQFWHNPGGNLYAAKFHSLTFYGMKHIFGSRATKALVTQVIFSGMWEVIGGVGTQMYLGGSDCCFWMDGYANFANGGSVNSDTYNIIFETLAKTNVGTLYLTCYGGWSGMLLSGSNAYGAINFHGGVYEGAGGSNTTAPPITITGGDYNFHGGSFNYTVSPAQGVIVQSGGTVAMYSPSNTPAASAASPLLYQTAGSAVIYSPQGSNPQARWATGTTVTLPFNAISHNP